MDFTVKEIMSAKAPHFGLDEPKVDVLISLAENQTGTVFGGNRNLAVALLVLHWLAKGARKDKDTPMVATQKSEGDLSVGYSSSGASGDAGEWFSDRDLTLTQYGVELLSLAKKTIFVPRFR